MKILITPDVPDWAIGTLTRAIVQHADHRFQFVVVNVHPRQWQGAALQIRQYIKENGAFDLWHCMYWNSGEQLMDNLPELKDTPRILTHTNHNALEKADWNRYDATVVATNYAKDLLGTRYRNVVKIPYGVDLDRYSFIDERKDDGKTVGYVGRVVPWKHLKETVEGAKVAGATVLGSGYIDKPEYFETVDKTALEWHGGAGRGQMTPSAFKDRLYERMTVFVMYSTGEYESGTLPLLEAMASGVPVMATSQGMARDLIEDGKNGIIFTQENFNEKLKALLEDRKLQESLRQEAWKTIKGFSEQQYSLDYQRLYIKTIQEKANKDKPTISIVLPTKDRPEQLKNSLLMIERQLYDYKEVIVIDDGSTNPDVGVVIRECKRHLKVPIIHLQTGNRDGHYGLAHARNMGIMEALGDIVLFLDDRLQLEPGALEEVANAPIAPKKFYWGAKLVNGDESTKRAFIENFAWCRRRDIIEAGMFPEWLQLYGGMSQEIRTRLTRQGWDFVYNPKPAASQQIGSGRHTRKDQVWRSKFLLKRLYD